MVGMFYFNYFFILATMETSTSTYKKIQTNMLGHKLYISIPLNSPCIYLCWMEVEHTLPHFPRTINEVTRICLIFFIQFHSSIHIPMFSSQRPSYALHEYHHSRGIYLHAMWISLFARANQKSNLRTINITTATGKGSRIFDEETRCTTSQPLGSSMCGLVIVPFNAFFVLHRMWVR